MAKKKASASSLVDARKGEPIVLVGQPDRMQGELFVHNPGEKKIVVRDAQVRAATMAAAPLSFRLAPIPLRPGLRRRVPLSFAIDPGTPPASTRASWRSMAAPTRSCCTSPRTSGSTSRPTAS
ncbi:MAG: hypothetical protein M5R40_17115 [Anaerolineae bacterium]|nr:hypothetical protein [Anaerolineae bacterium]